MLNALKPLLTSKKFLTAVLTVIANLVLRMGIELDIEEAVAITSPFIAYVLGQSAVDVKKAGLAGMLLLALGCGSSQAGKRVATNFVDCMTPAVLPTVMEYLPAMRQALQGSFDNVGKIDRAKLKETASTLKTEAGRCVLSSAVSELVRAATLALRRGEPRSERMPVDVVDVQAAFEEVRTDWGGPIFRVEGGAL